MIREKMNTLNIAKTLVSKRREKGITQDELANYIGVTKASVSKWETGQSYPDITFLPLLASYFNITVDELISYEPQLMKEDIKKLYHRLCSDFTSRPFDDVLAEIREITKKYFSCFPLLFYMGMVLVNHHDLAGEAKREPLLGEALELFARIRELCADTELCRQAKCMEATCCLLLNRPAQILELLQNGEYPMTDETILLAQAQKMNGNIEEACETLQVGAYQKLVYMLQNLIGLLPGADVSEMKIIETRVTAIAEAFEMEKLSPATMFNVYLCLANAHLVHGETEEAAAVLERYTDLAVSDIYPLVLHGDDFFNRIDRWLSELDLGAQAPRANATVKAGIAAAVKKNPAFAALEGNVRFKFLKERLSALEE